MATALSKEGLYDHMAEMPRGSVATYYEVLPRIRSPKDKQACEAYISEAAMAISYPSAEHLIATASLLREGVDIQRLRGLPDPDASNYTPQQITFMAHLAIAHSRAGEDVRVLKIGPQVLSDARDLAGADQYSDPLLNNLIEMNLAANFWTLEEPEDDNEDLTLTAIAQSQTTGKERYWLETNSDALDSMAEGVAFWQQRYACAKPAAKWQNLYRAAPKVLRCPTPKLVTPHLVAVTDE